MYERMSRLPRCLILEVHNARVRKHFWRRNRRGAVLEEKNYYIEYDCAAWHRNDLHNSFPVASASSAGLGDFFLTLKNSDRGIGNEGYLLKVGDAVIISANTSTGVFYGTRTILQILLQDSAKTHIVRGTARDYPRYQERGFMLDVGRKFFCLK